MPANVVSSLLVPVRDRFTQADVAREARMSPSYLSDLLTGRRCASAKTATRIKQAVVRLLARQSVDPLTEAATLYRVVQGIVAEHLGYDLEEVRRSDPALKQTNSPEWSRAMEARRLAQYLMNTGFNINQTMVAKVSGVTKQAVSLAVRAVEERLDNPRFNVIVCQLEELMEIAQLPKNDVRLLVAKRPQMRAKREQRAVLKNKFSETPC